MKRLLFSSSLFFLFPGIVFGEENPLDQWTLQGPSPTLHDLDSLTFGQGMIVVKTRHPEGKGLVKEEGGEFVLESLGLPELSPVSSIQYRDGKWLAVQSGRVFVKERWQDPWTDSGPPGWEISQSFATENFFWISSPGNYVGTFLSPRWINKRHFRSRDGTVWEEVTITGDLEIPFAIFDIEEAEDHFVLVNGSVDSSVGETGGIWNSEDGVSWTPVATVFKGFSSLAYGNGRFVASGPTGRVAVSDNGTEWEFLRFPIVEDYVGFGGGVVFPRYSSANQITFYDGRFHCLARQSGIGPVMVASVDGIDWLAETRGSGLLDFRSAEARVLSVAEGSLYLLGSGGELWKTENWETARERILPYQAWDWVAVAASESIVVFAGENGNFGWSENGASFEFGVLPEAAAVYDLVWSGSKFLAVGGDAGEARVWQSADGKTWESSVVAWWGAPVRAVVWDGERFLISGDGGRLASSIDGLAWVFESSGTSRNLRRLAFADGRYVATTDDGWARWTMDFQSWGERKVGEWEVPVAYGNARWLFGERWTTTNFEDWDDLGPNGISGELIFAFGHFLRLYDGSSIRVSVDGSHWDRYGNLFGSEGTQSSGRFRELVEYQGRIVAVGDDGLISVSEAWRDLFREWQTENFSEAQLAAEAISGPSADPDGDGLGNAVEYALRLNPLQNEIDMNPVLLVGSTENLGGFDSVKDYSGRFGLYLYPRVERRMGVKFWIERSTNLKDWRTDDIVTSSFGSETKSYIMLNAPGGHFLRLRADVTRVD